MERQRVSSGAPWEPEIGYCRAVRAGNQIFVSGTVSVDRQGQLVGPGDPYVQAKHILSVIATALEELGSGLGDVVRTRIYLANFNDLGEIARAHKEAFADHPPANTTFEVPRLIDPAMRVEIEADAVMG